MAINQDPIELLKNAREGDRGAWEALIDSSRDALEVHIRRRLGNHLRQRVDREDVFQETMTHALRSVGNCYASDYKSFLRWSTFSITGRLGQVQDIRNLAAAAARRSQDGILRQP